METIVDKIVSIFSIGVNIPELLTVVSVARRLLLVPVGALLAVLCLLARRAAAVGSGDVLLLLRLGLHLAVAVTARRPAATAP